MPFLNYFICKGEKAFFQISNYLPSLFFFFFFIISPSQNRFGDHESIVLFAITPNLQWYS